MRGRFHALLPFVLLVALPAAAAPNTSDLVAQALALEHGEGVPKDQLKAAALYCRAAREGDPEAMFNLGWMYANGRGIPRDNVVAAALFSRAAAAGHAQAKKVLPLFREEGGRMPECMRRPISVSLRSGFAPGDNPFANLPPNKKKIAEEASKVAERYAVDPMLVLAIIAAESNFEPAAMSPKDASGLMQLIPETAARFNVRNRRSITENVRGGVSYLRWLLAYYQGRVALAVAAYNAGEGAVDRHRGIPPYRETRDYVKRVQSLYGYDRLPFDPSITEPSPMLVRYRDR
jgi:hypothetical protein